MALLFGIPLFLLLLRSLARDQPLLRFDQSLFRRVPRVAGRKVRPLRGRPPLAGTAWFSYAVVNQSSARMLTHFVYELSQNLYFIGLVLTYALWGVILKLRETRALLVQLVLSLGVYSARMPPVTRYQICVLTCFPT